MTTVPHRPIAIVTGASSGIGLELAHLLGKDGYDLFLAADQRPLEEVAAHMRTHGGHVEALQVDLATAEGVAQVVAAVGARPVAVLMANAGHGLGRVVLIQDFQDIRHVINTNITGTVDLIQQVARGMRDGLAPGQRRTGAKETPARRPGRRPAVHARLQVPAREGKQEH